MTVGGIRLVHTASGAPATEPVTIDDVKSHVRVDADFTDEDVYLSGLVTAAREHVESITGRSLITQTWEYRLDRFPVSDIIPLPRPPVQSVTTVAYTDTAGDPQTLTVTTDYTVHTQATPPFVAVAYGATWPGSRSEPDAIVITYVAGYGDGPDDVPAPLRQAMLMLVAHWYEHREPVIMGVNPIMVPLSVDAMLAPYRVAWFR